MSESDDRVPIKRILCSTELIETQDGETIPMMSAAYIEDKVVSLICHVQLQRDNNMIWWTQGAMSHRCVEAVLSAIKFFREDYYGTAEVPVG